MKALLAVFANGEMEYVVIITDGTPDDHAEPGYRVTATVEVDTSDAILLLPTDRPLRTDA